MEKKFIINEIEIKAKASKIWDVLTKAEYTKEYMFGCETVSDWKVGSLLEWKGKWDGQDMIFVKGFILKNKPFESFVYTVFDPNNSSIKDVPENYLTVSYELKDLNGMVQLKVTQGDYNLVEGGEKRYAESYNNGLGWSPFLEQIKIIAERD